MKSTIHHLNPKLALTLLCLFALWACAPTKGVSVSSPTIASHEYQQLAMALELCGELQQALLAWRVAAALDPENVVLPEIIGNLTAAIEKQARQYFMEGVTQYTAGKYDTARLSFLKSLRLWPSQPDVLSYLKQRLPMAGHREYEVQKGDSFSKIALNTCQDPKMARIIAYFNHLDPERTLRTGTRLILPELPPVDAQRQAGKSPQVGNETRTSQQMDLQQTVASALQADPETFQLGLNLLKERRYAEALAMFDRVSPELSGRAEAVDEAQRLLREHQIDAALKKVELHLSRKEYAAACGLVQPLSVQTPDHPQLNDLLLKSRQGWARELIRREQEAKAIEILQSMDQSLPETRELLSQAKAKLNARAEGYYRRGVRHFLNEDLEKAIQAWKTALALNPNHPKAAGDMQNAQRLLEKWQGVNVLQPN